MANSPMIKSCGVIGFSILSNGQAIPGTIGVLSIETHQAYNQIPLAIIKLVDGDMANETFPVSDTDTFKPGNTIIINAGYDLMESKIFEGIVIKHGVTIQENGDSILTVECRDKTLAMTMGRKNANYINKKDSEIISELVNKYSGISSKIEATAITHKELVQFHCSDWDYLVSRAEANGQLVLVENCKVTVKKPVCSEAPALTITYGTDIIDFSAEMSAQSQYSSVSSVAWDPATQKIVEQKVSPTQNIPMGNIEPKVLAAVLCATDERLQSPVTMDSSLLRAWAEAQNMKNEFNRICGHVTFQGSPAAKAGVIIELKNVGLRFTGNVLLTSVCHTIRDGDWITEAEFGKSAQWFYESHSINTPPAAGLCGAVSGLQIGVVLKLDADPLGQYRIQLAMPLLKAQTEGVWARIANFYGTSGAGAFFIPEIGDEVVVGFLNDDPSSPIILGSMYSSKIKSPKELTAENNFKAIITKNKLTIAFDDDKKVITLETPGKNQIVISDDGKSILLKDQNSNTVTLNDSGIVLNSASDIKFTAKGGISLDATAAIEINSKADVKVTGLNINQEAKVGLVAKGSATAELSASGQTVIKGAMVMIN